MESAVKQVGGSGGDRDGGGGIRVGDAEVCAHVCAWGALHAADQAGRRGEAPAAMAAGGEASSSAPGGETVLGRRVRGEAFDDEAPTLMAEGDEASGSAPPGAKRKRGKKRTGRTSKMSRNQRKDELSREEKGV